MKSKDSTYTGFEFEVEGFPAIAIINKDLKDLPEKGEYSHSVFIEILPDAYNEMGHPEKEEYDYLMELERKMIQYLEEQTRSVHVGHTTVYRRREVIFYTKDPEIVETFLTNFLLTIERTNSFEILEDPEWENVEGFYELL
jgi:hypothetical protein